MQSVIITLQEEQKMPGKLSEKDSTALYFVRVVAILASVAAHVSIIDTSTPMIGFFTRMWDMISCISVPGFLIVGGILYTRTAGDSISFWKRKTKSIILPWLFCGLLTYGYRSLYEQGSLLGLFFWILGNGSWLYYVTMYLILLAVFKPIHKSVPLLWGCVAITAVQFLLKVQGAGIPSPLNNAYLNPLHWMGFFALGILVRRHGLQFSKVFFALCAVVLVTMGTIVYRKWIYEYFHVLNAAFTISAFFVLFAIGRWFAGTKLQSRIREIGTYTYCIYLLHMPIVLPILRRIPGITFKAIFAPVIGMIIMVLLIRLGIWITKKLPFGDKLRLLVGLR